MIDNESKIYLPAEIISQIDNIASSSATLLITGDSGVGKDIVARRVHEKSSRNEKDPVIINISAIPADLLEKELFGSARGSFTGANEDYEGKLIKADKTTLILDGINELPITIQAKLLKFIESGLIQPIGSNELIKIDCRIIGIANSKIYELVAKGHFRKDLYYRLNVLNLEIPPLKDRINVVKTIVNDYLILKSMDNNPLSLTEGALEKLIYYDWPGNIRELQNTLERAITLSPKNEITSEYLLLSSDNTVNITRATLKEAINNFKKNYIIKVLESNDWNVTKSAKILDIQRTYLSRLIKELYNE